MRAGRIMDFNPVIEARAFHIDLTIETRHQNFEKIRIDYEDEEDFLLGVQYWGAIFKASETIHEAGLFSPRELEDIDEKNQKSEKSSGQPSNPFFTFGTRGF